MVRRFIAMIGVCLLALPACNKFGGGNGARDEVAVTPLEGADPGASTDEAAPSDEAATGDNAPSAGGLVDEAPAASDRKASAFAVPAASVEPATLDAAAPAADDPFAKSDDKKPVEKPALDAAAKGADKTKPGAKRPGPTVNLEKCLVRAIEDVQVPGKEPGVMQDMKVVEGQLVQEGTVLALIDDSDAKIQKLVKKLELTVELEKAKDEVEKQFAKASYDVADVELKKSQEANRNVSQVITEIEIERLKLAKTRARLQFEKAVKDQGIAKLSAQAKQGEVDAADLHIKNRVIKAPFTGVVERILKRKGEWVQAGEPVFQLIRVDRLRVEAFIDTSKQDPGDLIGRSVEVTLPVLAGKPPVFRGKVESVGTELTPGSVPDTLECRIWVAVENQFSRSAQPMLRPGHQVSLSISLPAAPLGAGPQISGTSGESTPPEKEARRR